MGVGGAIPVDKIFKGVMSEWGERFGHKVYGEVIPDRVKSFFSKDKGGISELDANTFSRAIDEDETVREPLEALIDNASSGNDDAYSMLSHFARDFDLEDTMNRVQGKTQRNMLKSQGVDDPIINRLSSTLEEKKAAWTAKYQTGETGKMQPVDIQAKRAGETPEVPLASGNRDELLKDLQEYIRSNEEIARLSGNKAALKQPKKGWQAIFGNVLDENGFPMRLDGGRATSRGPLKFTSTSDNIRRKWKENVYIASENPKRKAKARVDAKAAGKKVEKHHVVGIEQTSPFGFLNDGSPRTEADIQVIEDIVKREVGIDLANKDWNEIYPSAAAHMGVSDDPVSSAFGVHRLLDNITDFQGFRDWRHSASSIKFEMPLRSNQKNPTVKWFQNQNGILFDRSGKEIGDIDAFKDKYPGANPVNFKIGNAPGTYNINKGFAQKHGFSNELLATISRIEDPEIAGQALVLFLKDSGAADTMEAAAALAFRVVDHGISDDEITKQFAKTHAPQMIELAKYLLNGDDPLYKGNPILQGVIRAEESRLALTKKLGI